MRSIQIRARCQVLTGFYFLRHIGGDRGRSKKKELSTLADSIATRSAADVAGSAWPCTVIQNALLSITPGPENVTVPTISEAQSDFANG